MNQDHEPLPLSPGDVVLNAAEADDAALCLCQSRYYAELARRFDGGFDPSAAAYSGADKPGLDTYNVLALAGEIPVGCGSLQWQDRAVAEIKRMWVAPEARGFGIARRILLHLEDKARALGIGYLRLDTNRALAEAHALYRSAGFSEIARYSDNPYAHHWFGKSL